MIFSFTKTSLLQHEKKELKSKIKGNIFFIKKLFHKTNKNIDGVKFQSQNIVILRTKKNIQ
jgi:hypothetical protein